MSRWSARQKTLFIGTLTTLGAGALLLVLLLCRTDTAAAERFSRSFAQTYIKIVGPVISVLPFSVYEVAAALLVLGCAALLTLGVVFLCKKKFFGVLCGFIATLFVTLNVLSLYTLTAGFAYYRAPPPVPKSDREWQNEEVIEAAAYFRADFADLSARMDRYEQGSVLSPYTVAQLSDQLAAEFKRLDDGYYYDYTPRAKGLTASKFFSAMRITGVTFLPLAEPTVNVDMPAVEIPQTMAHEMAHAKGVGREGDANLVSYYLLLSSADPYLRYCGYYVCYTDIMAAARMAGADEPTMKALAYPEEAARESYNSFLYWSKQPDIIGDVAEFFNNLYLKMNGADDGTGSYDNPTDSGFVDTGNVDGEGKPVYKPVYSELQRVFFGLYEGRHG